MPSRRTLLRTAGTALSLGLAGCLGSRGGPSDGTTTDATTGPSSETTSASETTPPEATTVAAPPTVEEVEPSTVGERGVPRSPEIESETYEPFRGFVVGRRPDSPGNHYQTPHVWVWNLTGDPTTMELVLTTGGAELRRIEAEFPAGAPLAVVFRERGTYELTVRTGDRTATVTVERDRFRCNASGTDVAVRPDTIETDTISTMLYCTTTPGGSVTNGTTTSGES